MALINGKTILFSANVYSTTVDSTKVVAVLDGSITELTAKDLDGLKVTSSYCLINRKSLKTVELPEGVTQISEATFQGCSALENVTLPSTLIHIVGAGFANCAALKTITIPENVRSIGANTFKNCSSLEQIYIKATTPPSLANVNAITEGTQIWAYGRIAVPRGCLDKYTSATNWSSLGGWMREATEEEEATW